MKKRSVLFASTVAAMALAGSAAHAERGSDGELKILFWQAVSTLNPYLSGGTKEVYSSSMVIEPLARYDEKGELVPMLESEGLGLLVWSPLAGGLLSGKYGRDGKTGAEGRRAGFSFPPVDQDRGLAVCGRHGGDTHVEIEAADPRPGAAVLRQPPFGDVETGQNLHARDDRTRHLGRWRGNLA